MPELIAIGRITKSVGIRGELRVLPLTDELLRFKKLRTVFVGPDAGQTTSVAVKSVRIDRKQVVLKIDGVDTVEAAEGFRDRYLFVPEKDSVHPKSGSYFIHDILNAEVVTEDGQMVGVLKEVVRLRQNDVWMVWDGEREILIPAVKKVIRHVDLEKKRILIHVIEGLLD